VPNGDVAQVDRALFEALGEEWLGNDVIRAAQTRVVDVLGRLLARAQAAGAVRSDVGAIDVLMMFKGACIAATSYAHADPAIAERQLDLMRASLAPVPGAPRLRGRAPTLEDLGLDDG
jgi:hypothetical protein